MSVLFPFVVVRSLFCYIMHLLPCFVICICYPVLLYAFFLPFCCLFSYMHLLPTCFGKGFGGWQGGWFSQGYTVFYPSILFG